MRTTRAMVIIFVILAAAGAFAANPNWPNGPDDDPRDEPPDDLGNSWALISYTPDAVQGTINPDEAGKPTGISADRAWQVTTGRPDVVLAIMDSGIYWDDRDLVEKMRLNPGELPLPEDSLVYDADDNGVFNVRDYAHDLRVTDANSNGVLDAEDLILIFSDDVDDDGNGYVDDICGWDFFWNDNDPYDETRAGHGSAEARWSGAQGNNGRSGIGTCPRCMILPLRVGDDFAENVAHVDEAAVYAVDNGATIIQHANGSVNATAATRDAVNYAYDREVAWVGAMNDENSFHNNYPSALPRIINVKAVTHDDASWQNSTSFLRHSNCSGYGPRVTVSATSSACSSGATGLTAGVAGLLYSRARDIGLDPPLAANEVRQLLATTADDIDISDSLTNPELLPSKPGWEWSFGYGRVNARAAVDRVGPDTMPPRAELRSPAWFEYLDTDDDGEIVVEGLANAPRASTFSWVLQAAPGAEPDDAEFATVCSDAGLSSAADGTLCAFDPLETGVDPEAETTDKDRYSFTLRLRVTDNHGNTGEDRVIAYWRRDPDMLPGYPKFLGTSLEASPTLADVDGDGREEIVVAASDGYVHAFKGDGREVLGFPVRVPPRPYLDPHDANSHLDAPAWASGALSSDLRHTIMGAPAVAYLDHNDDEPTVVVTTMEGAVCAWGGRGLGVQRPGFPVWLDPAHVESRDSLDRVEYGVFSAPVLADLDGDGELEIIVSAMDHYLYAWNRNGGRVPGFPVNLQDPEGGRPARSIGTPAVGDLDGDGRLDIVVGTNERDSNTGRIYAVHGDGNLHGGGPFLAGWPVRFQSPAIILLPYVGEGTPTSPVLADLDGDGLPEVAINSGVSIPIAYGGDGQIKKVFLTLPFGVDSNSIDIAGATAMNFLAFANIDHRDGPELLASGATLGFGLSLADQGRMYPFNSVLFAWDTRVGWMLPAYPRAAEDWLFLNAPSVADLDNDGLPEVIIGSGGYLVHAWNRDGDEPANWPKFAGGWLLASTSVGDIDGDGYRDVVAQTREGWLFAWSTPGRADTPIETKGFHHDVRNTGNYTTPIDVQDGPAVTTTTVPTTTTSTTSTTHPWHADDPAPDDWPPHGDDDDDTDDDTADVPRVSGDVDENVDGADHCGALW